MKYRDLTEKLRAMGWQCGDRPEQWYLPERDDTLTLVLRGNGHEAYTTQVHLGYGNGHVETCKPMALEPMLVKRGLFTGAPKALVDGGSAVAVLAAPIAPPPPSPLLPGPAEPPSHDPLGLGWTALEPVIPPAPKRRGRPPKPRPAEEAPVPARPRAKAKPALGLPASITELVAELATKHQVSPAHILAATVYAADTLDPAIWADALQAVADEFPASQAIKVVTQLEQGPRTAEQLLKAVYNRTDEPARQLLARALQAARAAGTPVASHRDAAADLTIYWLSKKRPSP